jgi:hypothetical protein
MLSKEVHSTCDKSTLSVMETSNSPKNVEVFKADNRITEFEGLEKTDEVESITQPARKYVFSSTLHKAIKISYSYKNF